MTTPINGWLRLPLALLLSATLFACSDSSDRQPVVPPPIDPEPPEPELTYSAEVVWTEYGIPHVTAEDWGSLGYGSGYTLAKENYCTLMWSYVMAEGNTARYKGEEGSLDRDLLLKALNDDATVERLLGELPAYIQDNLTGYAAGINRYLNETGIDNLAEGPEGCRGAQWVREVTLDDIVRVFHMLVLYTSSFELAPLVTAANPDDTVAVMELPPEDELRQMLYASTNPQQVREAIGLPSHHEMGSNAYAVGADASQTNSGILFGNPHFPWQGNRRFFMFHLTMGDEYDVMGASLIGTPMPLVGFNQDLAWSATVSAGQRFTFYELTLNPENKMQYLYDGEYRDITSRTVTAQNMTSSGLETVEHTLYFSHFGPIVDLGAINPVGAGWPNGFGTLVTYRDANLENLRVIEQMIKMGQASNMAEFQQANTVMGDPWANFLAADRHGDAFYGDMTTTPHVSVVKTKDCVRGLAQDFLTGQGILTMEGSDSACEWGRDSGVPEGIFNYDSKPTLETREYAANANDSYWISNPRNLIDGYPLVMGEEGIKQSIRTRHTFSQAERRLNGQDEYGEAGFNIDNIRQLHSQATNHAAELAASDVVAICSEVQDWSRYTDDPENAAEACGVLKNWDRRHQLESVGAHVFHELWQIIQDFEDLWSVPFNVTRPLSTPASISLESGNVEAIRQALADAATKLKGAGIALDAPWGEIHYIDKNGTKIGLHGGNGDMMFSNLYATLVEGEGYEVLYGNSYIQAVTWDESDCPIAYGMLTYSQSTDPASDHYADATKLYSEGGWIDMPFCEAARDEQEIGRMTLEE